MTTSAVGNLSECGVLFRFSNNSELKVEEPLRDVSIRVYLTWFGIRQVVGVRVKVTVFRAEMRDAEGLEAQEPW